MSLDRSSLFRRFGSWALREPLIHFALGASLLSLGIRWFSEPERDTIVIQGSVIEDQVKRRSELVQRPLTASERQALIDSCVEEEILFREARKRGYHREGEARVRLARMMQFLLNEEVGAPTGEDLRRYFESNADRYAIERSLTLEHVSFVELNQIPPGLLDELRQEGRREGLGYPDLLKGAGPRTFSQRALRQIAGVPFSIEVFQLPPGQWYGPLDSKRGVHFVRVTERHPPKLPAFEDIQPYLIQDWYLWKQRQIVGAKVADLRKSYTIVVDLP